MAGAALVCLQRMYVFRFSPFCVKGEAMISLKKDALVVKQRPLMTLKECISGGGVAVTAHLSKITHLALKRLQIKMFLLCKRHRIVCGQVPLSFSGMLYAQRCYT